MTTNNFSHLAMAFKRCVDNEKAIWQNQNNKMCYLIDFEHDGNGLVYVTAVDPVVGDETYIIYDLACMDISQFQPYDKSGRVYLPAPDGIIE